MSLLHDRWKRTQPDYLSNLGLCCKNYISIECEGHAVMELYEALDLLDISGILYDRKKFISILDRQRLAFQQEFSLN